VVREYLPSNGQVRAFSQGALLVYAVLMTTFNTAVMANLHQPRLNEAIASLEPILEGVPLVVMVWAVTWIAPTIEELYHDVVAAYADKTEGNA